MSSLNIKFQLKKSYVKEARQHQKNAVFSCTVLQLLKLYSRSGVETHFVNTVMTSSEYIVHRGETVEEKGESESLDLSVAVSQRERVSSYLALTPHSCVKCSGFGSSA